MVALIVDEVSTLVGERVFGRASVPQRSNLQASRSVLLLLDRMTCSRPSLVVFCTFDDLPCEYVVWVEGSHGERKRQDLVRQHDQWYERWGLEFEYRLREWHNGCS